MTSKNNEDMTREGHSESNSNVENNIMENDPVNMLRILNITEEEGEQMKSNPLLMRRVNNLIQSEMKNFEPKISLEQVPNHHEIDFSEHPFLQTVFDRVKNKDQGNYYGIDKSRFTLREPENKDDLNQWKTCMENAQSQIEHMNLKILNLQLLNKYGANSWLQFNSSLDQIKRKYENEFKETCKSIQRLKNSKRKLEHSSPDSEVSHLSLDEQIQEAKKRRVNSSM